MSLTFPQSAETGSREMNPLIMGNASSKSFNCYAAPPAIDFRCQVCYENARPRGRKACLSCEPVRCVACLDWQIAGQAVRCPDCEKYYLETTMAKMTHLSGQFSRLLQIAHERELEQKIPVVQYQFYDKNVAQIAPKKGNPDDAGTDLPSVQETKIPAGKTVKIRTNIVANIKPGHVGLLFTRSGYAARGLQVVGGVIDSGFLGEVKIVLKNDCGVDTEIRVGDFPAQMVTLPAKTAAWVRSLDPFIPTARGENGFGSTDTPKVEFGDTSLIYKHGSPTTKNDIWRARNPVMFFDKRDEDGSQLACDWAPYNMTNPIGSGRPSSFNSFKPLEPAPTVPTAEEEWLEAKKRLPPIAPAPLTPEECDYAPMVNPMMKSLNNSLNNFNMY